MVEMATEAGEGVSPTLSKLEMCSYVHIQLSICDCDIVGHKIGCWKSWFLNIHVLSRITQQAS